MLEDSFHFPFSSSVYNKKLPTFCLTNYLYFSRVKGISTRANAHPGSTSAWIQYRQSFLKTCDLASGARVNITP